MCLKMGLVVLMAIALMVISVDADEVENVKGQQNYIKTGRADFIPPSAKYLDCVHQAGERGVCIHAGHLTQDSVLIHQGEEDKFAFPFIPRESTVVVQLLEPRQGVNLITFINVTNLQPIDDLGFAKIIGGGVGYKNVSFYLESQRGKGYRFLIEVYAARFGYYGHGRSDYEQPTVTNNQQVYVAPDASQIIQAKIIPVKIEHYAGPQQFQTGNEMPSPLL